MIRAALTTLSVTLTSLATPALAHSGHGHYEGNSITHLLVEHPVAGPILAVAVAAFAYTLYKRTIAPKE